MDKVIEYLYVGNFLDAEQACRTGRMVVLDVTWPGEIGALPDSTQIRTTKLIDERIHAVPEEMERAALWIDQHRSARRDVLVHCLFGIERSPLTIVWYLMRCHQMDLDEAYALIRTRRGGVLDRRHWLPYRVAQDGRLPRNEDEEHG